MIGVSMYFSLSQLINHSNDNNFEKKEINIHGQILFPLKPLYTSLYLKFDIIKQMRRWRRSEQKIDRIEVV